jgi:hypothetical protein
MSAILLVACTTGENMRQLHGGETKAEVEAILGRPDGYRRVGNTEALTYAQRLMSGWSWDKADYQVILVDGRVAEYGPGTIRPAPTPSVSTLVIVPLR